MASTENNNFDAGHFVDALIEDGGKIACDETVKSFQQNDELPPFYDKDLYKRGCQFYHKYIFGLFFSKLLGLLTILAVPSTLQILQLTQMSSSPKSAYKRYLATLFHMCVWYDDEFVPGSKMWKSVCEVRCRHNSASKRGCAAGLGRISQKDMALTQFGFMGYALSRSNLVGVHHATEDDWHGFIHVWRVVGHVMGIEERFNICRESVDETREICNLLISKVLGPLVERKDKDFMNMGRYLIQGMWAMNPTLNYPVYINYLHRIMQSPSNCDNNNQPTTSEEFVKLTFLNKFHLAVMTLVVHIMKFDIFRLYFNYMQYITLWLMHVFPFLAYYKYGVADSHVSIIAYNDQKTE